MWWEKGGGRILTREVGGPLLKEGRSLGVREKEGRETGSLSSKIRAISTSARGERKRGMCANPGGKKKRKRERRNFIG